MDLLAVQGRPHSTARRGASPVARNLGSGRISLPFSGLVTRARQSEPYRTIVVRSRPLFATVSLGAVPLLCLNHALLRGRSVRTRRLGQLSLFRMFRIRLVAGRCLCPFGRTQNPVRPKSCAGSTPASGTNSFKHFRGLRGTCVQAEVRELCLNWACSLGVAGADSFNPAASLRSSIPRQSQEESPTVVLRLGDCR